MIDKELYINWLKTQICILLEEDIKVDVHDEFSYNPNANIDITVKFLPGQIQCGIPQYPCELLIEINESYSVEAIKALTDLSLAFNETLISLGSGVYRQYYTTPNVVGTFQNRGITNNVAVSISASLVNFTNVLMVKGLSLETGDLSEEINFVNFNFSYMAETNSTGVISDPVARVVGESTATTYTFTFVPKATPLNQKLIEHMLSGNEPNRQYYLAIHFDYGEFVISTILQAGSLSQAVNGLPLIQLTFMGGDFNG
ncbi:MAG: hypothetical protein ACI35W_04025 [Anaeroplasmataceae bacterium]